MANTVNSTSTSVGTTALNGTVNGTQLAISNSSTVSGARALSAVSKGAGSTALFTNTGTGAALNLNVPSGRVPMLVSAGAAKVPNLDADKLDGLDSTVFAQRLWAELRPDGVLVRAVGVSSSARSRMGTYTVTFNRDVRQCAYFGNVGTTLASATGYGGYLTLTTGGTNYPNTVDVSLIYGNEAYDNPFFVQAVC